MGLFSNHQKLCPICGKPTPRLLAVKIQNMPLCKECAGKIDLPDGMVEQMSLEGFRQYIEFYDANKELRDIFSETYQFSFGLFGRSILLDAHNRLFRLNTLDNSLVMEASSLKSFCILEDNIPLFEGQNGTLKCYQSDVPARANAMAPQIAQFLMQHQMFQKMEQMQERMEREKGAEGMTSAYRPEPSFDVPAPFRHFYIELNLSHPYWGGFRGKLGAPAFSSYDPSIDSYLRDYQEEVDKLHTLAVNLIQLMDPNAREVSGTDNVSVTNADDTIDEIQKYKNLMDSGVITEEEFTAKKRQLLGI